MQRSPMGNCSVPVGRIASQRVSDKSLTDYEMASRQLPRPTVGTGSESGKTSGGGAAPHPIGRPHPNAPTRWATIQLKPCMDLIDSEQNPQRALN